MSEPVCAFQIAQLRKAITQKRKQLRVVGPKGKVQLQELLLGHKALPHVAQALDKDGVFETLSVPKLRRLWKQVADVYHKAVSKMSANQVIEYLYFTADQLNWCCKIADRDHEYSVQRIHGLLPCRSEGKMVVSIHPRTGRRYGGEGHRAYIGLLNQRPIHLIWCGR